MTGTEYGAMTTGAVTVVLGLFKLVPYLWTKHNGNGGGAGMIKDIHGAITIKDGSGTPLIFRDTDAITDNRRDHRSMLALLHSMNKVQSEQTGYLRQIAENTRRAG